MPAAVVLQLLVLALQRLLQVVPALRPAEAEPIRGAVLGLALLGLVAVFSLWRPAGFLRPLRRWHVAVALVPAAGALLMAILASNGSWSFTPRADDLAQFGMVGFNEELVGRGLILVLLARRPSPQAVLWSALIFACAHLANTEHAVDQFPRAVSAFADGALYAALWLRGANLGVLMLGHGLTDVVLADSRIQPDLVRLVLVSLAETVALVVVALRLTPQLDRPAAANPSTAGTITAGIAVLGLLPELAFGLFGVLLRERVFVGSGAQGPDADRMVGLFLWPPAVLLVLIALGAALGLSRRRRAAAILAVVAAEVLAIALPGGGDWLSLSWNLVVLPHAIWLVLAQSRPASVSAGATVG